MGLRDLIVGRFLKVTEADIHTPSEEAQDVERRLWHLELQLHERELRRDMVFAQVQSLRGH